ncbi:PucR family transcriptional regulator [Sporolactobacillus spathodeae]|uniref:Purine catabolism regulator n=1 Tax=Sporolactobacillus spathodeae TaxID=1465502 RepID=A0ABS2Q848_9BACL|nr:PucR family transcriptional regulator [Sporolactobacillus spathodeae]MBM7657928.1 purine catabolism regulator [Sporolactobacillus spathodeae]
MADEMSFCVKDVLKRPLFARAQLIAGQNGCFREVRWVHILEITHAAPYVSENDLILTTGLWLKQSLQSEMEFMRQIIEHKTSGLCIEFGTTIDEIPEEMIAMCDAYDFPLILFRQPVRFEEITQDIHSFIINRHFDLLKRLEAYSQKQQQLILQTSDILPVLRLLHTYTEMHVVYHSTVSGTLYYPEVGQDLSEKLTKKLQDLLMAGEQAQETRLASIGEREFLFVEPVICFGQIFSYIGVITQQPHPTEYMTLLLDYTAKAVATILLRTQFLEEKIMRSQNQLIQDILSQQIDSEDQAQMRMGLPSPGQHNYNFLSGIIEFEHNVLATGPERMETVNQDISVLLRSLLKKFQMHHLLMMKNNQFYLLCAKEKRAESAEEALRKHMHALIDGLQRFVDQSFDGLVYHVGFGKIRNSLVESWLSFKEAYQVIEVAQAMPDTKKLYFYDDIGIYQLLKAVPQDFLDHFIADHLGGLIDYDEKHHLDLAHTLAVFFRCRGSKGDTAKQLYIHRQTLYNRLDKISLILGDDFTSPQRRYCLEMALLSHQLRQSAKK